VQPATVPELTYGPSKTWFDCICVRLFIGRKGGVESDGNHERSEIGVTPFVKRAVSCVRKSIYLLRLNTEGLHKIKELCISRGEKNPEKQRKVQGNVLVYSMLVLPR